MRRRHNGHANGDDNAGDFGSQRNVTEVFNADNTALCSLGLLQIG